MSSMNILQFIVNVYHCEIIIVCISGGSGRMIKTLHGWVRGLLFEHWFALSDPKLGTQERLLTVFFLPQIRVLMQCISFLLFAFFCFLVFSLLSPIPSLILQQGFVSLFIPRLVFLTPFSHSLEFTSLFRLYNLAKDV